MPATKTTKTGRQTPTQSLILPYKNTLGPEAVALYESSGRTALPWQKSLCNDIMGLDPDDETLWVHQKFGYTLPRRNGKNEIVAMRELHGLIHGEQGIHTAHRTATSSSAYQRLCKILSDAGYVELGRKLKDTPDPDNGYRLKNQYGLEEITFPASGGRIVFRTRTASGGLGEGYDFLIIDEAQEYTTEQESALVYIVSASQNPQTIFCGTPPTLSSAGTVFSNLRTEALGGNTKYTGWAEWGVLEEPGDIRDKSLWYETNPSLGYHLRERTVESEIRGDDLDFKIQRLGYWYQYSLKSAISRAEWEALEVKNKPEFSGPLHVGIKYGADNKNVAFSIAVKTADEKIYVECIECRSIRDGTDWIVQALGEIEWADCTIDGRGGQDLLKKAMIDAGLDDPILPRVNEVIEANAVFRDYLYSGRLCHNNQPSVTECVSNTATRAIGSNGGQGYKSQRSDIDICLLDSIIFALWACDRYDPDAGNMMFSY